MIDDLRSIFEDDQHDALQQAGIAGDLLDDLTRHFSAAWLPQLNDEPVFDMSAFFGGDE